LSSKRRPDEEPKLPVTMRPTPIPADDYDRRIGEAVGIALAAIEREEQEPAADK